MHESQETGMPTDNGTSETGEYKSELPSQLSPGGATVLDHASSSSPDNFNPGWGFYTSFISLCIITVAVALDATLISVALPVISPSLPSIALKAVRFW